MPAHALVDLHAAAKAALPDPDNTVEWHFQNSVEIVSERLDLTYEDAMAFILEEICRITPECYCETKAARLPHLDVYRHDARGGEWYVKIGLRENRLCVTSFHPSTKPMRTRSSIVG